uniref:Uncharacterized protein n=1 Tax=Manihot esculenta TaxID=3983 RepID=A0A2C9UF51_MANES
MLIGLYLPFTVKHSSLINMKECGQRRREGGPWAYPNSTSMFGLYRRYHNWFSYIYNSAIPRLRVYGLIYNYLSRMN